ncbi:MAG: SUMF1/EgtB/PvdO family nonheme iron enzyme [Prevotellaceae bacterium]|jgi:serine/threonine protein kinase|nr:SUMF1/EgtB/PvdO family nonheme iron enzyme [Prevotellaceae bacterium]
MNELAKGTTLQGGKYTIERVIGKGGFGITYYARHNVLGHCFAIKEFFICGYSMRSELRKTFVFQGVDPDMYKKYLQKFIEEAQTLARLDHPNIVRVTDIFEENNTAYIVMPFVEGQTLQQIVDKGGRLDYETAVNYIAQVAEAVEYIHNRDILHRDIKPENIIITPDNRAILIDFGSAREFVHDKTAAHTSILTAGYAPPEQYSTVSRKGAYSDIYSLGATFYFALTARKPTDAAARTMEQMPEPRSLVSTIPAEANSTIMRAMELKPERRQQNAAEFMEELLNTERIEPEQYQNKKVFVKVREISTYHSVLGILLWIVPYGMLSPIVSTIYFSYKYGFQGWKNLFQSLHPQKISPIVLFCSWIPLAYYFIYDNSFIIGLFLFHMKEETAILWAVITAGLLLIYSFFLIGPQLKLINYGEKKWANKILNCLMLFILNIIILALIVVFSPIICLAYFIIKFGQNPIRDIIITLLIIVGTMFGVNKLSFFHKEHGTDEMVFVEGGTFTMGCTSEQGSDCGDDEKPAHKIILSGYYIGKYEVTQAQWRAVMGSNPSYFKGDNLPVESVSWDDVQDFIRKLNQQTGKNYRLPTEAEWEFAARGGNSSRGYKYSGSNGVGSVAWYDGNETHPVGTKQANELGIYDMSGNVWEWCSDLYGIYSSSSQTNLKSASLGLNRVSRGGSWDGRARRVRVSDRNLNAPDNRYYGLGFRLASSSK